MTAMSARLVAAVLALLPGGTAWAQDIPTSTIVLFDSVCLICHEGGCSGRMALRTSRTGDGLAGHVAGYAGPAAVAEVGALKTLMSRLKTECRLPTPPVAIPADGRWDAAGLTALQLPDRTRAFIPLGAAKADEGKLSLRLAQPQRVRVQIVVADFDILHDRELEVGPDGTILRWNSVPGSEEFLRLLARTAMDGLVVER